MKRTKTLLLTVGLIVVLAVMGCSKSDSNDNDSEQGAKAALEKVLSCSLEDVQAYKDAYSEAVTTATGETTSESGLASTDALSQYFKDKYGDVMTDECIESMMANRTMTVCIEVAEQIHMDIVPADIQLIEKSNEAGAYTYTAMLMTASDEKEVTAASVSGEITMVDGKASDLTIKVED